MPEQRDLQELKEGKKLVFFMLAISPQADPQRLVVCSFPGRGLTLVDHTKKGVTPPTYVVEGMRLIDGTLLRWLTSSQSIKRVYQSRVSFRLRMFFASSIDRSLIKRKGVGTTSQMRRRRR